MKRNLLILTLLVFIFIAGCKAQPVSLEYKTTDGEPPAYTVTLENKTEVVGEGKNRDKVEELAEKISISVDMTVTQQTIKAEKGNLMHEMIVDEGKVVEGSSGNEEDIDKGKKIDATIKTNGEPIKPFDEIPGLTPTVVFPEGPVGPGDTWTIAFQYSPAENVEPIELEGNYTLEKFETVKGLNCAIIKFEVPETAIERKMKMKFSSKGTMAFAYEKGAFVDFSVERTMVTEDPRPKSDIEMTLNQSVSIKMK